MKWIFGAAIVAALLIGFFSGVAGVFKTQYDRMGGYDLYACIENNAEVNEYPRHPAMIEKVQQECICFKEKGYNGTRILEEGCTYE